MSSNSSSGKSKTATGAVHVRFPPTVINVALQPAAGAAAAAGLTAPNTANALLLALDPGDTTGWAVFVGTQCIQTGALRLDIAEMWFFLQKVKPNYVACENFVLYAHKAQAQSWSPLNTIRLLGVIELYCILHAVPYTLQLAAEAKGFIKDVARRATKHEEDAIRHGYYFLYKTHRLRAGECVTQAKASICPKS